MAAPRQLTPVRKSRRVGLLQIKKLGPFLVVGDFFTDGNMGKYTYQTYLYKYHHFF